MKRLLLALPMLLLGTNVPAQIVHNSDVTIHNSLCVGFDCQNSESFGADTIRLKENNLRIHFDDTSVAGSFPRNDWRLEANSNANGGASYFSIIDATAGRQVVTVEAAAPSNSLYVEDSGDVGFGTSNPALELHTADGDTPALRLEQNTSSGFAAQTWDIAGNETSFFVRDATNGSTLPFRIFPGSPSNSLAIRNGDVGVGTINPSVDLHVVEADAIAVNELMRLTQNGFPMLTLEDSANGNAWSARLTGHAGSGFGLTKIGTGVFEFILSQVGDGTFSGAVTATGFNTVSSRSAKQGFQPADGSSVLATLSELPLSTWQYKKDGDAGARHMGPVAEDFHAAFGLGKDDKHISPTDMAGVALASVKELHMRNQTLRERNVFLSRQVEEIRRSHEEQEAKLAELERRMASLAPSSID